MRKLFNEFFYIPKYGKIREKVMLARVTMTIVIVVMCLAAMSFSAYAYFSYNITSGANMIKSANFVTAVTVQIADADGNAVEDSNITPITSDHKSFIVRGLEVGKKYSVTIEPTERSTAKTGFIIVSAVGCKVTYHTQQLGIDEGAPGGKTDAITFTLMITDTTDVILESHWGTSSYYSAYKIENVNDERYITLNDEIKMIVNGQTEPKVDKDNGEGSNDENKEPEGTNLSTNAATGTDASSTQATQSTTTPSTDPSTPAETTLPATTQTSEPTGATEPSSTTEPTTAQPSDTTATQTTTESTETTGAPTTEVSE